jgi:phosphoribosyl-ATP pyrophosphohydrolase/phosphoribosyl-AMP cyclohydrolase
MTEQFMADIEFVEQLEALIHERIRERPEGSYTSKLAEGGITCIAQKVGEEAIELALAAAVQDDKAVIGEAADLIYHVLVLLAFRHISLADVSE